MIRAGLGALTALVLAATAAPTAADDADRADVNGFAATASYQVALGLPAVHAIVPGLSLRYSSAGGDGDAGVGWSLGGLSVLERVGPQRGAPRWDRGDTYLLDGAPLVACRADAPFPPSPVPGGGPATISAGSPSPSCAHGGTHAARVETYDRIAYDATADRWTVTTPAGVTTTYAPVHHAGVDRPWRYGVVAIADRHGNRVDVEWQVNQFACCNARPVRLRYGDVRVDLAWERRPDVVAQAIGGATETRDARLRSVAVSVGGAIARVTALTYRTGADGRSLLAAVDRYGRDAVVDGTGAVTAGTHDRPLVLDYTGAPTTTYAVTSSPLPAGYATNPDQFFTADLDGDGRADLFHLGSHQGRRITTWRARADGSFAPPIAFDPGWGYGTDAYDFTRGSFYPADLDGDGRSDLVQLPGGWGGFAWRSRGDGTWAAVPAPAGVWYCDHPTCTNPWSTLTTLPGDVDGDGRTDFVFLEMQSPLTGGLGGPRDPDDLTIHRVRVAFARGSGDAVAWATATVTLAEPIALARHATCGGSPCVVRASIRAGDVDGDGRLDLIVVDDNRLRVYRSTGTGLAATPVSQSAPIRAAGPQSALLTGDFDGDGKTDLLAFGLQFAPVDLITWRSLGDGTFAASAPYRHGPAYGTYPTPDQRFLTGDVDGDGRTDVIHLLREEAYTWFARGDGTFGLAWKGGLADQNNNLDATTTGDVDGDGQTDVVFLPLTGVVHAYLPDGDGGARLAAATAPLGGVTRFTYVPSSTWPLGSWGPPARGGAVPAGAVAHTVRTMTRDDGRGGVATATYEYAGALFDPIEREFLGFRYVKTTLPAGAGDAAGSTETWYRQGYGFVAMPERVDERDGAGGLLRTRIWEHATNGATVPYTQRVVGQWTYDYGDPAIEAGPRRRYLQYVHGDAYGQVWDELDHGDVDVAGDEVRRYRRFRAPPAGVYQVDRVEREGATSLDGATVHAATYYEYDTAGDRTLSAGWLDGGDHVIDAGDRWTIARSEYDGAGNLTAVIDPLGGRTSMTYDAAGRFVVEERSPTGLRRLRTWDPVCGAVVRDVDDNGATSTTELDPLCRVIATTDPLGARTRTEYRTADAAPMIVERRPAPGGGEVERRSHLDGLGRVWREERAAGTPLAACSDLRYGARGATAGTTGWYGCGATPRWSSIERDALGRPTRYLAADGAVAGLRYGAATTIATDERGAVVERRFDAGGRPVELREHEGAALIVTRTTYDPLGFPRTVTDAAGNVTTTTFDTLGHLVRRADPDLGVATYQRDAVGHVIAETDARGVTTSQWFDGSGRLLRKRAGERTVSFAYDEPDAGAGRGRLTGWTDDAGNRARVRYDLVGHPLATTTTIDGVDYTLQQGFDADGRLTGVRYPDGDHLGRDPTTGAGTPLAYDALGRVTAIPGVIDEVAYDPNDRPVRERAANGVVSTWRYDDARGWLTDLRVAGALDLAFARDRGGLITAITSPDPADAWTYRYDDRRELTDAVPGDGGRARHYEYDQLGNQVRADGRVAGFPVSGAPRPHAPLARGADVYTYDAAGNQLTGGGRVLTWDAWGRLARVERAGTVTDLAYDPDGRRLRRAVDGVVTHYPSADYEVTGGVATKIISIGERAVAERRGALTTWLHVDHLGSIRATTDALGRVVTRTRYAPFGAGPDAGSALGYTGAPTDATGLVYLGARYYDPDTARFVSADDVTPAAGALGLNRYAYALNDPINLRDPGGHDPARDAFEKWAKDLGLSDDEVKRALTWWDRGIRFEEITGDTVVAADLKLWKASEAWTGGSVMVVIQALETIEARLGTQATLDALGLKGGATEVTGGILPFIRWKAGAGDGGVGGLYGEGLTNEIGGSKRDRYIVLYLHDTSDAKSVDTAIHELGHAISYAIKQTSGCVDKLASCPRHDSETWRKAAGWTADRSGTWTAPWTTGSAGSWSTYFPSEYASTATNEDYADSFMMWLQHPKSLDANRTDYFDKLFPKP